MLSVYSCIYLRVKVEMNSLKCSKKSKALEKQEMCVSEHFKYIQIHIRLIPEGIIGAYNLRMVAVDSWVHIEVQKGMCSL